MGVSSEGGGLRRALWSLRKLEGLGGSKVLRGRKVEGGRKS